MSYQNIWVAMAEGIKDGQAFTARQRILFANGYAVVALVALAAGVVYWRRMGIL